MSKNKSYLALASLFMIMLGMSLIGGSRGVLVPVLKRDFLVEDSLIGTMFLCSTLGYMIFTYVAGEIVDKIGHKRMMQLGLCLVVVALGIMLWSPKFYLFMAGYFLNGAGNAFLIMGINLITPVFAFAFQAALLNIIHGSYGLGASIIQRLTGYLLIQGISWRTMFIFFMAFNGLVLLLISFSEYPQVTRLAKEVKAKKELQKQVLTDKVLYFYMFALGLGLIGEQGINNWFINFLKEGYGLNENIGSQYLSLFFILFTIGRFAGGFVMEKTGYIRGLVLAQAISFVLFSTGLILGTRGFMLIAFSGLFQSIVYPTLIISATKYFKDSSAYALSVITIVSSALNNSASLGMGILNDQLGVLPSFYVVPFSVLLSMIAMIVIGRLNSEKTVSLPLPNK